jgi:hypothetical protein
MKLLLGNPITLRRLTRPKGFKWRQGAALWARDGRHEFSPMTRLFLGQRPAIYKPSTAVLSESAGLLTFDHVCQQQLNSWRLLPWQFGGCNVSILAFNW